MDQNLNGGITNGKSYGCGFTHDLDFNHSYELGRQSWLKYSTNLVSDCNLDCNMLGLLVITHQSTLLTQTR